MSMVDHMLEPPRPVRRLEVITGVGGRRRWSADEKARILVEAMAPGAVVSDVARRHGISPQHLFTWRRQAMREADDHPLAFTPVLVAPDTPQSAPPARREAVIKIVVEGAVNRVPSGADGTTLARVLHALKSLRRSGQPALSASWWRPSPWTSVRALTDWPPSCATP
ncbi:transposase [Microvirga guangxiensis]|uniref:Transposase n=1 Tax=Microvirga guangxiensis TaxID=549386 RepID=A0A1G5LP88_9HYPH|nr:transposase [Microvirga guangxiensis]